MDNNQMESFNGATVRHREKVVRGLKKEDSVILTGLRIYHNHVKPHLGLEGKTPGEVAGIHIEGNNPWKTIIQAAAKSISKILYIQYVYIGTRVARNMNMYGLELHREYDERIRLVMVGYERIYGI